MLVAVLCKRTVRVTLEISLILEKKKEKKGGKFMAWFRNSPLEA